jgi:hypothetical protein
MAYLKALYWHLHGRPEEIIISIDDSRTRIYKWSVPDTKQDH